MRAVSFKIFIFAIAVTAFFISAYAGETNSRKSSKREQPLQIKAVAWGPTQADVDAAKARATRDENVRGILNGAKARLLSFEYLYDETADKSQPSQPPPRFRVTFYNYSTDKAVIAEGSFKSKEKISWREIAFDPGVSREELDDAAELVKKDAAYINAAARGALETYEAMPPVSNLDGERLVNIGIRNRETGGNEIVGVSFKGEKIVRYESAAPPTARVAPESCGITQASQGSTGEGVAGQYQLTILQGTNTLWEMLVVRPSSSSGAVGERSGLEVRDVKYKGKSVLKRGHAPVLNVKYNDDICGPYRDWQYSEGFFNAPAAGASNPAPGMRVLAAGQIATTAVETRDDTGNFQGVAVYQQDVGNGSELVLVTEMNAGWYRYISEWRFAPNGTIRPRFGFGSVTNSCVCLPRNHHVYWRFDFDVVQPANKVFRVERGRRFLQPIATETSFLRKYQTNRRLLIQNANGDEAYQLTPNLTDGSVTDSFGNLTDTFGGGDFWVMQFKGSADAPDELDDPNPFGEQKATLAPWVNGEPVAGRDVVVWYAAHQFRSDDASLTGENVIGGSHVVGPDLRAVRW